MNRVFSPFQRTWAISLEFQLKVGVAIHDPTWPNIHQFSHDRLLEEFLKLQETKPASEFVGGQMIQKPMPQGKHSTIQSDFVPVVNAVLKPSNVALV